MAGENIILVTPDYSNRELQTPATEHSVGAILREKLEPVIPASGTLATQDDITGLNDLSSGDVETAVGTALATYDGPTKAEMDAGFAGISLLSNQEKARLDLGFHQQAPLIETFRGFTDTPANFALYNAITDDEIAQQCSRYPNAVAWSRQEGNGTANIYTAVGSGGPHLRLACPSSLNYVAVCAFYPILITPAQATTWLPNDDRFIFEVLATIDYYNNTTDTGTQVFMGLAEATADSSYVGNNWYTWAETCGKKRVGFISGGSSRYIRGVTDNGVNYTTTGNFTPGIAALHHYKFVYDIGTDVKFYVDGALVGTVSAYLPTSNVNVFTQTPLSPLLYLKHGGSGTSPTSYIYGVRCYFQNGE